MRSTLRLILVLLAAGVLAAVVPLGLIAWWEDPDRFFLTLEREWRGDSSKYRLILAVFVLPAVANAGLGYVIGAGRAWALLPLCLAFPVLALVASAIEPTKGPIGVLLSLVPAGVAWLTGRLGQVVRGRNQAGSA